MMRRTIFLYSLFLHSGLKYINNVIGKNKNKNTVDENTILSFPFLYYLIRPNACLNFLNLLGLFSHLYCM